MDYSVFNSFPLLKTDRLILDSYQNQYVKDLFELNSDPEIMRFLDKPPAKDKIEILAKIKSVHQDFQQQKGINWTIRLKQSSEVIGYFGIWRIDHTNHRGEIGYALKKEFWKKGILNETARAVFDFAFLKLKLHSVMANINPENKASEKALTKLGFQKEAHFREDYFYDGVFLDSVIYCLLVSDWQSCH